MRMSKSRKADPQVPLSSETNGDQPPSVQACSLSEKLKKTFSYAESITTDEVETLRYILHSKLKVVYNGLKNQGATCYLNSALQVLFMTKEFREEVGRLQNTSNDKELLHQLHQLFQNLHLADKSVSTVRITKALSIKNVCEQQDAVEWFEKILSAVSQDASKMYQGTLRKTLRCLKQSHADSQEDSTFFSIPLSIDAENDHLFSMVDGLEAFFQTTRFDEDNWMYCDHCDEKTDTEISFNIQEYPTILVFHLKRFYFDMKMGYQKNSCPVTIPSELTFFEDCPYDLYGIINHRGVYGGGHYDAYIKSPENNHWYCFDDSQVTKITDNGFLNRTRTAYMIVYRKKSLPSPTSQEENTPENHAEEAPKTTVEDDVQTSPYALNPVPLSRAPPDPATATAAKVDLSSGRTPETLNGSFLQRRRQRKPEKGEEKEGVKRRKRAVGAQVLSCIRKITLVRKWRLYKSKKRNQRSKPKVRPNVDAVSLGPSQADMPLSVRSIPSEGTEV